MPANITDDQIDNLELHYAAKYAESAGGLPLQYLLPPKRWKNRRAAVQAISRTADNLRLMLVRAGGEAKPKTAET